MVVNLYGETVHTLDDVCDIVTNRAMKNGFYELRQNQNSRKQGFWLNPKPHVSTHDLPGIYSIFKGNTLEYIGKSDASIGGRYSRFVKEVFHKSRSDEDFAAARKWRAWHGSNLDDCFVMFAEYYPHDETIYGYDLLRIENRLIQRHRPRMNIK
jgi:hypothetical protein